MSNPQAEFFEHLTSFLNWIATTVTAHPWLALVIAFSPGLPGLLFRSVWATLIGGTMGVSAFVFGTVEQAFLILWPLAWVLSIWIGAGRARKRTEERRHQETLEAIRQSGQACAPASRLS